MGNTFALLIGTGAVLTAVLLLIKRPCCTPSAPAT